MIRVATVEDAEEVLSIYAPYVNHTAITFEYDVPDLQAFRARMAGILEEYPFLVAEEEGKIVGYAYASAFHGRAAYKHSAESSIYLSEQCRRRGIGRQLYHELEKFLLKQNVFVLYACVTSTDRQDDRFLTDGSIRFHQKMGYSIIGEHHLCGYKFHQWYSVVWMEKALISRPESPEDFIPFPQLQGVHYV